MKTSPSYRISGILLMFVILAAACSPQPFPEPTSIPSATPFLPSATPAPATATQAPSPTNLPTASPIPAASPTPLSPEPLPDEVLPGEIVRDDTSGFAFTSILGYEVESGQSIATITHGNGDILINLGIRPLEDDETPESALEDFLKAVGQDVEDLETGEVRPVQVSGQTGAEADLTGTFYIGKVQGKALVVPSGFGGIFVAMGFGLTGEKDLWAEQGREVFQSILASTEFFTPVLVSACDVSTDPTYGFTPDNPILIGGDYTEGPGRAQAYLGNLLGPAGEELSSFRLVSYNYEGAILDVYIIKYDGLEAPVKLHLNVYAYKSLLAPQGFICAGTIPIGSPGQGASNNLQQG